MKYKSTIFKSGLVVATLFVAAACSDLAENPAGLIDPKNFFTTTSQAESVLAGSMNKLWQVWSTPYHGGLVADTDDQLDGNNLNIDPSYHNDLWTVHYQALLNVNGVIAGIKNGNITNTAQSDIDAVDAEAKFLRGYNYFQLVRLYGEVPLLTEDTPDPVSATPVRASIADVYAQIETDLLFAVDKLPAAWSGAPGKPTKAAAQGLLAKVYVTMATAPLNATANYAKARDMAKAVIDAGTYSLVPDIHDVFKIENRYGPEMIWGFNSTTEGDNEGPWPQNWTPDVLGGWDGAPVDTLFFHNFPVEPRRDAYIMFQQDADLDGDGVQDHVQYPQDFPTPYVRKYVTDYLDQPDLDVDKLSINILPTNFPIVRYADVLLIFAEADNFVNGGPTQADVDAVNQIIDRATGGVANAADPKVTTALSQSAFDDAVIRQRDLEFCFEGDRWFDIIRKRILLQVTRDIYKANVSDEDYLFPIPPSDAALIGQNKGYGGD